MKCYKEKELIIFDFENGKRASYNMNTGETIGKMGKPVQTLASALAGMDINDILNSFTDEKYRNFLREVHRYQTPHTYRYYSSGSRVTNLGTLLNYAARYRTYEKYYLAGLNADWGIRTPLSEVPKGLLKLCRTHNKQLTDSLIKSYKSAPNMYQLAFSMEFENISSNDMWNMLCHLTPQEVYGYYDNSHKLVHRFNYDLKALLKYIDYLCTFEGLVAGNNIVREIGDYANMMHNISEKFEKYPRYFLSTHKIAARNYERLKHQFDEQRFAKQIKPEYEITHKDYKFFYPKCTQDIKDEAVQQQNCVASYIGRVIDGYCDILFLRKKDAPTKSVVTIEVRNGKIVQAFQAYNTPCNEEQREAIEAFNKKFYKEAKA